MNDLFETTDTAEIQLQPLAERLRPKSVDQVIGQSQILGVDAPLGAMLASGKLGSIISSISFY